MIWKSSVPIFNGLKTQILRKVLVFILLELFWMKFSIGRTFAKIDHRSSQMSRDEIPSSINYMKYIVPIVQINNVKHSLILQVRIKKD